jgi:hypothetical protein
MKATLLALAAIGLGLGCSSDRPQGNPEGTASIYTAERGGDTTHAREQTHQSSELEAPEQLAGFRPQLERMARAPLDSVNENLPAYRQQLAHVVDAMQADLTRAGQADTGDFRSLPDSVLNQLGGGAAGAPGKMTESERRDHVARVRRLIGLYQRMMGASGARQPASR